VFTVSVDFVWDITPKGRDQQVTFTNKTIDDDDRFNCYSWQINDHYNIYNPDNSDYGNSEPDNTQIITRGTDKSLEPKHNFQDDTDEDVTMWYYYDDGYRERENNITKTISKSVYTITPDFTNDKETVGKMEVIYKNDSTGDISRELDEDWYWNDVKLDNTDTITTKLAQAVRADQKLTWQYPSRKPFSAVNGATADNVNKEVKMTVRIDTGWRDYDDGSGDNGGQVYWTKSRMFEAKTFEVSSYITYECNVDIYTH